MFYKTNCNLLMNTKKFFIAFSLFSFISCGTAVKKLAGFKNPKVEDKKELYSYQKGDIEIFGEHLHENRINILKKTIMPTLASWNHPKVFPFFNCINQIIKYNGILGYSFVFYHFFKIN